MKRFICMAVMLLTTAAMAQDSARLQRQIDKAIAAGQAPVIRLGAEKLLIDQPIDFRGVFEGAAIIGQGFDSVLESRISDRRAPMINLTGCTRATLRDFRILGGQPTNDANAYEPACGLLFARAPSNASAGMHVIDRVWIRGRFVLACIANFASEGNTVRESELSNHEGPSKVIDGLPHGGHLMYFSNGDYHSWVNVSTGKSTMLTAWVHDCIMANTPVRDVDQGSVAVMIYSPHAAVVGDIHLDGINSYSKRQRATFACDMPQVFNPDGTSMGGQTHVLTVSASRFEEGSTDAFWVFRGGREVSGLTVRDSQIMTHGVPFDFGTTRGWRVTLENLRIIRIGAPVQKLERFYKAAKPLNDTLGRMDQLEIHGWADR